MISEAMGHSSIGVTSSLYIHLFEDTKREKAVRLNAFFAELLNPKSAEPKAS
jgi:integrase